ARRRDLHRRRRQSPAPDDARARGGPRGLRLHDTRDPGGDQASSRRENVMSQFAGKVALVTGGNAGIGRAAASQFAKQGARVVVSGRREKEGHADIAEIKALGGEAGFVKTDVSKASDVKVMIDQ